MSQHCRHDLPRIRGLCRRCYDRARRAGTLEQLADPPRTPTQRASERRSHRPVGATRHLANGYVDVWDGQQWVREHRRVMEKQLGRALQPGERVRHRNGRRSDNTATNLVVYNSTAGVGVSADDTAQLAATLYRGETLAALAATIRIPPHEPRERAAIVFARAATRTGLTRSRLADELGIDTSYLSQMLRQRRPIPSTVLLRILDLAGTPLETVLPD